MWLTNMRKRMGMSLDCIMWLKMREQAEMDTIRLTKQGTRTIRTLIMGTWRREQWLSEESAKRKRGMITMKMTTI